MACCYDSMDVGLAIRFWRKAKGMTQGHIAKKNNWERSYISDLERGKIKNPQFLTVLQLVHALDISCNDFVEAGCGALPRLWPSPNLNVLHKKPNREGNGDISSE